MIEIRIKYTLLLDTLMRVIELNKGKRYSERLLDADALFVKYFYHSLSVLHLYNGSMFQTNPDNKITIRDFFSINVLIRAAIESCLNLYWLFIQSDFEDECEFRYLIWKLTSLSVIFRFGGVTREGIGKINNLHCLFDDHYLSLKNNNIFKSLPEKEHSAIVKCIRKGVKVYGRPSWTELSIKIGIPKKLSIYYSFLCDFAHSGNLGISHYHTISEPGYFDSLCGAALSHNIIYLSKMIKYYCSIFPDTRTIIDDNVNIKNLIEIYSNLDESTFQSIDFNKIKR